MRQQDWQAKICQNAFCRATEDEFSDPGVTVSSHHQHLRAGFDRMLLQRYTDRAILGLDRSRFCLQATFAQPSRQPLARAVL